jgi:hypothetical protein
MKNKIVAAAVPFFIATAGLMSFSLLYFVQPAVLAWRVTLAYSDQKATAAHLLKQDATC